MRGFLLLAENIFAGGHIEIVGVLAFGIDFDLVTFAQIGCDLRFGLVNFFGADDVCHHVHRGRLVVECIDHGADRHHQRLVRVRLVARFETGAFQLGQHANDHTALAINPDGLPDRGIARKQVQRRLITENANGESAEHFFGAKKASLADKSCGCEPFAFFPAYRLNLSLRCDAFQRLRGVAGGGDLDGVASVARLERFADRHLDPLDQRRGFRQVEPVFVGQFFAAGGEFAFVHAKMLTDLYLIRAEKLEGRVDGGARAIAKRQHGDDRSHANHHAQHG